MQTQTAALLSLLKKVSSQGSNPKMIHRYGAIVLGGGGGWTTCEEICIAGHLSAVRPMGYAISALHHYES